MVGVVFGGERGIRTPGSAVAEQRFSRPPHSTTLPFLQITFYHILLFFVHRRKDNIFLILKNLTKKRVISTLTAIYKTYQQDFNILMRIIILKFKYNELMRMVH